MNLRLFFCILISSLYLAIAKHFFKRRIFFLLILIKVDEGKGGGSAKVDKKFLNVNIIDFAKVEKGEGIRRLSTKSG